VTAREVSEPNARPHLRQRFGRGFLRLSNPVVPPDDLRRAPNRCPQYSPGGEGSAVA